MRSGTLVTAASALLLAGTNAFDTGIRGGRPREVVLDSSDGPLLQDIVTWDEDSLYIHGERVAIFSGEVHPFRLPVPSLYLDVFQKIKALGFNMVSFYVDWALLEGKPGHFRADGIFDLEPFFEAATQAGIYLLARPGPYINAEASGGGFPGWLARVKGILRTNATDYLDATDKLVEPIRSLVHNFLANISQLRGKCRPNYCKGTNHKRRTCDLVSARERV
jgi:hypothetical protein